MASQFSIAVRNAWLDAVEAQIGVSARVMIWSGAMPANCAAANAGTKLADVTCPADWMAAAAAGVKSLLGTWTDASADASGVAVHFRIYDSAGTTCHWQGTCGTSAADMILSTVAFTAGLTFTITACTLTAPNA